MSSILPTRVRYKSAPPHPIAEFAWLGWLVMYVVALTGATPVMWQGALAVFLGLELTGWLASRSKPWGATLSEVIWWRVPIWWGRVLVGLALGFSALALIGPWPGVPFLFWLVAHFMYTQNSHSDGVGRTATLVDFSPMTSGGDDSQDDVE